MRCRELGLHTEAVSGRAWRRLKALRADGVLPSTPVSSYPGEVPVLLERALGMARRKGASVQTLARDLHWPEHLVEQLLECMDSRPTLDLQRGVPEEC